jgi:CrcB protein
VACRWAAPRVLQAVDAVPVYGGMDLQRYLLIALGGALGSMARFWLGSTIANRMGSRFPYGTLVINITACVIIGFSLTLLARRTDFNPAWRFLVPIGFVGGFSTFSAYEWETFSLIGAGASWLAVLYSVGSLVFGLVAVWCGAQLAEIF